MQFHKNILDIQNTDSVETELQNFIKDQDVKIFRIDPYHTEDYILNKKHLIDIWCDLVGVQNNQQGPKLFFSPLELQTIQNKILNTYKLGFDGIYIDNIQMGQMPIPGKNSKLLTFAGCACNTCKNLYYKIYILF